MPDPNDFNARIIDEFRANQGKVGAPFAGAPMVLLTTTGAKSGRKLTTPLVYLPDGDRIVVFASKGGAPRHPAWYHNLVAHPQATVEVGTEKFEGHANVIKGEERDALYARQAKLFPAFAQYEAATTRVIPVVAFTRNA
jgi:deazaflavin-dependent oxidoreductase (nitroreductase family)